MYCALTVVYFHRFVTNLHILCSDRLVLSIAHCIFATSWQCLKYKDVIIYKIFLQCMRYKALINLERKDEVFVSTLNGVF